MQVAAMRASTLSVDQLQRIAADDNLDWDVRNAAADKLRALLGLPAKAKDIGPEPPRVREPERETEPVKCAECEFPYLQKRIENQRKTIVALQKRLDEKSAYIAELEKRKDVKPRPSLQELLAHASGFSIR
jgi:hypothetical protein